MSARRALVAAAVAAVALAGCSSSHHNAAAASRSTFDPAFAARANAVCAAEVAQHQAHPFPLKSFDPEHPTAAQLRTVAAYFSAYGDTQGFDRKLHALGTPADEVATWQQLLGLVDRDTARAQAQQQAGTAGDVAAWTRTLAPSKALYAQIVAVGRKLGFTSHTACGRYYGG